VGDLPQQGSASIEIESTPDAVWRLVSDVTRMGQWSPECFRVEWAGPATGPALGAEFHGYNRLGTVEWDMRCVITECEPGRVLGFAVPSGSPHATLWRFRCEPSAAGTTLTESFNAPLINVAGSVANYEGRFEMMLEGANATLANIKAAAEADQR
jgi:uncharacterized protein YndB with AHSA1/START domain